MSFRAIAALALLLCALAAERCGYFAARSVLVLALEQQGLPMLSAVNIVRASTFVSYVAAFGGGGLALAFGPRVTATVGAGIAAIGAFALAAGAPVTVFCFVLAIGAGIFKACPYAAAAEILADEDGGAAHGFLPTPRRFASVATFCVVAYGAINVGGFVAPLFAGALRATRDAGGFGSTYAFTGAVDVVAAICAGIAIFLGSGAAKTMAEQAHAPYRGGDGAPNAPRPAAPPIVNDVFVPLTLLGVVFAAMHFVMDHAQPNDRVLGLAPSAWIHSVNPIVVLLMTVPCAALFFVLTIQRAAVPLTRILGAGLVVFAIGGLLASFAMFAYAGLALWVPSLAINAIGEAIAFPIGLTYASLVKRSRAATMVVAGWVSLTALPNFFFDAWFRSERFPWSEALIVVLSAVVVIVGGVLVVAKAPKLHADLAGRTS